MTWAAALAAVVSILGAAMATFSARRAEQEARSVTTLNHKVAALDRQAEQLREDYRALVKAIGDIKGTGDIGAIMAAGELLRAHPQASFPLTVAIGKLIEKLGAAFESGQLRGADDLVAGIRGGFRHSLAEIDRTRTELLDTTAASIGARARRS
jgi:outer membrane murein-binding lipoprotein Lpp